jgi:trigger factor
MASVTKEQIGNLHDKLLVKVTRDDYYPSFEKAIKDYSKKARIPGFRSGMVPTGMIKKMYGSSIFYDEVIKSVEKEIQKYLGEKKPEIFAQPLPLESNMTQLDMNNPVEYEFPFEMGLKPEIKIDELTKARPTLYKVNVTDEMVAEEIEKLVTKYGELKDAETVTAPENVLNVIFEESDAEGNILPDTPKKDNSILVQYFSEVFRSRLKGLKKDDFVTLQLKDAFEEKEREWILSDLGLNKDDEGAMSRFFRMTITKIGLVEKKELNEAFFGQVFPGKNIGTEEEFKATLKEQLQHQWDEASKSQLHDQLYHLLLEKQVELPDAFLKRWLAVGGEKKKSAEEVEAEYPAFVNQLKWTLISDKIITDNKIEVSKEELRDHIREEILHYFGQVRMGDDTQWIEGYVDRMMEDQKQVEGSYRKVLSEKLFKFLEDQVVPVEKQSSPDELLSLQHHHAH